MSVRFVTTSDGVRIAYFDYGGDKPPLLWTPGWVSHIELETSHPHAAPFYRRFAANHRLVHFDGRGTGLSDRDVTDVSLEARLRDMEAVIEGVGLETFDMFAWSFWGPVGIVYAAEHPERVRRLALYATFARFVSDKPELAQALLALIRAQWSIGSRTITEFVHPAAHHHDIEVEFAEYFRRSASGEIAAMILEEGFFRTDVSEYLPRLTMPTAVLHRVDDNAISPEAGRQLARGIPGARFIPLAGNVHVPWHGDTDAFVDALEGFFGMTPAAAPSAAAPDRPQQPAQAGTLSTLLFTDIAESTTFTQRLGDAQAQEVVRAHDTIVREAVRAHGGFEVKHTGDGIMASFPTASGALECAIDIQRALASRAEGGDSAEPLRVRIGVNAGEPVAEGDDLFGTAVQLARRICDAGDGGEILVSDVVRQLAAGKGFLFADRGVMALKGFEDPVRVYELRWREP
ncbi:MAG: adenylate/guanylate cyclase domain-containing protein [Dehalococcoidia bacterium]